jgi:tetratricopeptide (TPR) repeat protein
MRLARFMALATLPLALLAAPLAGKAQPAGKEVPGSTAHATAQRLLYSGQIARAISVWQDALSNESESWEMAALGATLYADGQFARAAQWLQRASVVRRDDWTLRLFAATAQYEAGQLAAADEEFQAIVKGSPNRGTVQIASDKLARRYFQDRNRIDEAMLAKGTTPDVGPLWIGRLVTLPLLQLPDSAALHDDGTMAVVGATLIMDSRIGGTLGSESVHSGDSVRMYGPVRLEVTTYARHQALITARVWKRDVQKGDLRGLRSPVQWFEFLLWAARSANSLTVLQDKVRGDRATPVAAQTGQWADVEQIYSEAVRLAPDDPQVHTGLGRLRGGQGNWPAAEQELTKALARWPDYPPALFGLAFAHGERGQTREKTAGLARVVEVYPVMWETYVELAAAYGKLSQTAEASTALQYAKEVAPDIAIPESLRKWDTPSGGQ